MTVWVSLLTGLTAALLIAVAFLAFLATRNSHPATIVAQIDALKLTVADHGDRLEQLLRREKTLAARVSKEQKALQLETPVGEAPATNNRKAAIRQRLAQRQQGYNS